MVDYKALLKLASEKHNLINAQALLSKALVDVAFQQGPESENFALVNRVWSQVTARKLETMRELNAEFAKVYSAQPVYPRLTV